MYFYDLSQLLSGLPVAGLCGNHVSYADDMYLLSLSALGLQTLVHVCLVFAVKHDIIFNVRKPVCMLTRSRNYTHIDKPPIIYPNGDAEIERYY